MGGTWPEVGEDPGVGLRGVRGSLQGSLSDCLWDGAVFCLWCTLEQGPARGASRARGWGWGDAGRSSLHTDRRDRRYSLVIHPWLCLAKIYWSSTLRQPETRQTPRTAAHQAFLSFAISQNLLKLMSVESVMPSNHLILCCPLLLLPSIFPSIRVFSNELTLRMRWPKYWSFSFSFSISPSNKYSGLISFRMDWFDLFGVQGTLKSLLLHHSSKPSVLQRSASLWSNSQIRTWLLENWK